MGGSETRKIAEKTRRACLDAAARAYQDAKLRGMCSEGAWDYALDAIRNLDMDQIEDEDQDQARL